MTAAIPAAGTMVAAVFNAVPLGTYAIAAFHDLDGNDRLDTTLGIPKKPSSFSNGATARLTGTPSFARASFVANGADATPMIALQIGRFRRAKLGERTCQKIARSTPVPNTTQKHSPLQQAALLAAGLLASGCATRPPASSPEALAEYSANRDPLEPTNRFLYGVNDTVDRTVLKPVAQGYRYVVPGRVRQSVGNALGNAASPAVFANDVLQGHPRKAAETITRFVVNSTAGVGGLFDVATHLGLPPHRGGSFGTTLAVWGVGDGPYLFLPVLGPSNVRDTTGFAGNTLLDPLTLASFGGSTALQVSRTVVGAVDTRERLLDPVEQLKRDSLDPYATFRSVYRQSRASEIEEARHDGKPLPPPKPLF